MSQIKLQPVSHNRDQSFCITALVLPVYKRWHSFRFVIWSASLNMIHVSRGRAETQKQFATKTCVVDKLLTCCSLRVNTSIFQCGMHYALIYWHYGSRPANQDQQKAMTRKVCLVSVIEIGKVSLSRDQDTKFGSPPDSIVRRLAIT